MTTKQIKMWLIALGFLLVAGKLVWTIYVEQDRCLDGGGQWDAKVRVCQTASP